MLYTLVALVPLVVLFALMIPGKQPAHIAAPITLGVTGFLSWLIWQIPTSWLVMSFGRGLMVTIEIILIVAGALLLLNILKKINVFEPIILKIKQLTADRRIQAILIGWFFVSFIEGAAGFGTPAILAAPLLMVLGFKPLVAVVVSLIGDSVAVTFGAVGVPVTIGLAEGLGHDQILAAEAGVLAAGIHVIAGLSIPLFISLAVTYLTDRSVRPGLEIWPYALLSGACFLIPYYFSARWFGPELPSILGGLLGAGAMIAFTKYRILTPGSPWQWRGDELKPTTSEKRYVPTVALIRSFFPYFLIMILLLLTRLNIAGAGDRLENFTIKTPWNTPEILNYTLTPLFSPGFLFFLVGLLMIIYYRLNWGQISEIFSQTGLKLIRPVIGLISILGIVQIFIYSDHNLGGLPAMPVYLAEQLTAIGNWWPLVAPAIGLLGSFISGSATVSNLLLTAFQAETALTLDLPLIPILALQAVGSAAGNMIAVHNILAVAAVVGLVGYEGRILKATIGPALIFVFLAGILGVILTGLI